MGYSQTQLKQIIKEEIEKVLKEEKSRADIMDAYISGRSKVGGKGIDQASTEELAQDIEKKHGFSAEEAKEYASKIKSSRKHGKAGFGPRSGQYRPKSTSK